MPSTTIYKFPMARTFNNTFLRSSFTKAITPLRSTAPSQAILSSVTTTLAALLSSALSHAPSTTSSSITTISGVRRARMLSRPFTAQWATTLALLSITLFSYCSLLITPATAAPAKHTLASNKVVNSMALTFSDTSALPLQLQIESQVRGTQKLAYLPTTGPSLDFYYLNYRPTYIAGQSTIDFWMISPKGIAAPKTASLELFDEFGKIHLATLVKEGTEIPQGKAASGEPFLWKSWVVPKDLKADFDFSDKFRVILKTSFDSASNPALMNAGGRRKMVKKVVKVDKRSIITSVLDNIFKRAAPVKKTTKDTPVNTAGVTVVQDRQFRIKGLKATPGGKVNPAKLHVNSVAPQQPNAGADAKVKTTDTKDASTPANNKDTTTSSAAPVVPAPVAPQTKGRKSSAVSSVTEINLSVSVIVAFTVALLSFLGLLV
ncbi:hypothetical protein EC957_009973 [Mortierella hygrophila]|uniref:Uncharacterized protein n=1 Tax=Mortierella hygrophila TaxID=979708 RepID=A0A9P6FBD8_9FUNG|nr:hypothetical protein EC957_009973 [Mortierella hygrophila]